MCSRGKELKFRTEFRNWSAVSRGHFDLVGRATFWRKFGNQFWGKQHENHVARRGFRVPI